ncbi:hypothetical protein GFL88_28155 [Rhizobium leguminosarum bv. viciae]|uniref:DUF6998 domain-containing protein n=1 Tax=Rhizobium leguminosarum TaxID=384 RepID=UPI0014429514|nr:hypothetical protein [Rhizobium leguminosarum bv. viciae]
MTETISLKLPPVIKDLVAARDRVKEHYNVPGVDFTLDGKLVGDIGEVVASKVYGIVLKPGGGTGIDGTTQSGIDVQIKATGKKGGAAFRQVDKRASHLIFIDFNFNEEVGVVMYNGPEHLVLNNMPEDWGGKQRTVARGKLKRINAQIPSEDRLPIVDWSLVIRDD